MQPLGTTTLDVLSFIELLTLVNDPLRYEDVLPERLKNKLLNDATEIDSLYGKKSNEIKKRVKMASKDDVANDDTIEIDVKPMAASTTEEDELDWLDEQI